MDDEQHERVNTLVNKISAAIRELVNNELRGVDEEVDEAVREKLGEDVRFWR